MAEGSPDVAPWSRVVILIGALTAALLISWWLTGSLVPQEPRDALIFQSSLLLIVLGSAVIEHKFTKPADSVVNALTGLVTLMTVYAVAPKSAWWLVFGYCAVVAVVSLTCTIVSTGPNITGRKERIAQLTYPPAVFFGRARLLHSIVFLFGVFAFYRSGSREAAVLVAFWGLFVAVWPLGLPEFLSRMRRRRDHSTPVGRVIRREWPNLLRVQLQPGIEWSEQEPCIYEDADGAQQLVIPVYKQVRDQHSIGTALSSKYGGERLDHLHAGHVYRFPPAVMPSGAEIATSLGADEGAALLGFVVEESRIAGIRFETWRQDLCKEGLLVWSRVAGQKIYYQITEGFTREEALQSDRLGSQVATAAQMGLLDPTKGFLKCEWLPDMNTPVFAERKDFGTDMHVPNGHYTYGKVPGTELQISGAFTDSLDFHTAILGVTGSGKTELALDLIRHSASNGVKVVCIDLTARYEGRLEALQPVDLSIPTQTADELGKKIFAVETGEYRAQDEKIVLAEFADRLRDEIASSIADFMKSKDDKSRVGIITLNEISNTKATLFITELYMTCLLKLARDQPDEFPRTMVVVEEAHTVMPEPSTVGLGDYDSRGLVSKISQIALQGRKYRVGLLVVAQRTATVTKNVLTQCNTVVAFNSFDETSTAFLAGMFGRPHAEALRDLASLQAIVFGKGVSSQRPIIVQIPYDPAKATELGDKDTEPARL